MNNTLGTNVTLTWKVPEDDGGCKIGLYIIEYYRVNNSANILINNIHSNKSFYKFVRLVGMSG